MKKARLAVLLSTFFFLLCSPVFSQAGETQLMEAQKLFDLVNNRLSYMKDVAAYKWVKKSAIEDKARELVVINKSAESAAQTGLDAESIKDFFRVQIKAAKKIQWGWHAAWKKDGFPQNMKFADLKKEIRPALIDLGNRIIVQIKKASPGLKNPRNQGKLKEMIKTRITVKYVDHETKQELLRTLSKIKH